jgi:hypothetical protein
MLVHDREPPERPSGPPGREPVEPDWRLLAWIATAVALFFLGFREPDPSASFALVFAGFFAALKAFERVVGGDGRGLRDWRQ